MIPLSLASWYSFSIGIVIIYLSDKGVLKLGHFDKYPPLTNYDEKLFNKLLLIDFAKNIHPVINEKKINAFDEYIFVMFNKTFYRQSKGLIKIILKNYKDYKERIIFINNDSYIYTKFEYGF